MGEKREDENRADESRGRLREKPLAESVSRGDAAPQQGPPAPVPPTPAVAGQHASLLEPGAGPLAHVVLYQPEIPQNTGNIGRTCVATGASLWVVRPAAFRLDDRSLRRAGLDYWQHLDFHVADQWADLRMRLPERDGRTYWYFSRFAERTLWDAAPARGDVLVFGSETAGLPDSLREAAGPRALRLPTSGHVRSLNLATTVAVALYDVVRRFCG